MNVSALIVSSAILAAAQSATSTAQQNRPSFDVASVKPTQSAFPPVARIGLRRGRVTAEYASVVDLLRAARGVRENAPIIGAPSWATTERYDIDGRAKADLSTDDARAMLEALLADRFSLRTHIETRPLPIFALVVANPAAGTKLRPSPAVCRPPVPPTAAGIDNLPPPPPPPPADAPEPLTQRTVGSRCVMIDAPPAGYFSGRAVTLPGLAFRLSRVVDRPVVDRTGMSGEFDLDLTYLPEVPTRFASPDAPSIFTAVQEQLGLKLDPATGPVDVLVIDRVERPTAN